MTTDIGRPRVVGPVVAVGAAATRWYVTFIAVVRVLFHDGTTIELITPGVDTDGTESALRLAGIAVFDLNGAPRPRPEFPPSGFVPVRPRRLSTPAQARARVLGCSLLAAVTVGSGFAGLYLGNALARFGEPELSDDFRRQCASQLVQALGGGQKVLSGRVDSAIEFGQGNLIVGAVQVDGSFGAREVAYTCASRGDGVQVTLAE